MIADIPMLAGGAGEDADYRVAIDLLAPGEPRVCKYFDDRPAADAFANAVRELGVRLNNGVTFTKHGIRCITIEGREGIVIKPAPAVGGLTGRV